MLSAHIEHRGGSALGVVLDAGYHGYEFLKAGGVPLSTSNEGRPVNLGVLNLMPQADQYELELIRAFARVSLPLRFTWIRIRNHGYSSSNPEVLAGYRYFDEVVDQLDGLIVTGAAVEKLPFEAVRYWSELEQILSQARLRVGSTLGICWGGLAIAGFLGMAKDVYHSKLFGVFPTENLVPDHRLMGSFGKHFACPVSTHAGIAASTWARAEQAGTVQLLARSAQAGGLIGESADGRFLIHLGHPEYGPHRLPEEYARDCRRILAGVAPPQHVDLKNPSHDWALQSSHFFESWVKLMAEKTNFPRQGGVIR